jgi:PBP1b-binding outer membrane lipoprotein LpoB
MQDPNLVSREQLLRQALITQTGIEEAVDSVKQKYSVGHLYRKENIEGIINEALDIHVPNFTKIIIASLHEPKLNFPELTTEQIEVMLNEKPRVIQENNRISDCLEHIQEVKQKLVGLSEWASKFPEKLSEFLSLEEVTQVMLALEQQISNS